PPTPTLLIFSTTPRPPRPTLVSLHDALPIFILPTQQQGVINRQMASRKIKAHRKIIFRNFIKDDLVNVLAERARRIFYLGKTARSEEHTSELQSRENLVCRLLLEKKNKGTSAEARGGGRARERRTRRKPARATSEGV